MMLECLCKRLFTSWHCSAKCSRDGGVMLASAILEIIGVHHHAPWDSFICKCFLAFCFFSVGLCGVFLCGFFVVVWGLVCRCLGFFGGFEIFFFFPGLQRLHFLKLCQSLLSFSFSPSLPLLIATHTSDFWKNQACMYSPNVSSYCQAVPFVFTAWSYLYFPSLPITSQHKVIHCSTRNTPCN